MSKISFSYIPAGTVIFERKPGGAYARGGYQVVTLAEDLYVENVSHWAGREDIPPVISDLISSCPPRTHFLGISRAEHDCASQYWCVDKQLAKRNLQWPDGTDVDNEVDYFTFDKGTDIIIGEDWAPYGFNKAPTFEQAPRKYNGRVGRIEILRKERDGIKPGVYLNYAGNRWVDFNKVAIGTKPGPRKESETKGPTFRQLFVPGTKWKVTKEFTLPAFKKVQKQNQHGHTWMETVMIENGGSTIKVGTEFKVEEKNTTYGPGWVWLENDTRAANITWNKIKFDGVKAEWSIPSKMKDCIERVMTTAVETNDDGTVKLDPKDIIPAYYIFDTKTGQYYKSDGATYQNGWTFSIEYADAKKKHTGCKNWKRLADARRAVMDWSGYYVGLPGVDRSDNYFTGGDKKFDIPDTWEIHEIDKATRQVTRKIDIQGPLKRSWRLRELTVKYGSAVRQVYSDLEKKDKLDEFTAMVVFTKRDPSNNYYWDWELTDSEKAEIDSAVEALDKKDIKRAKGDTQVAFAIKDVATGLQIRLTYTGELEVALLNLGNLTEVLDD